MSNMWYAKKSYQCLSFGILQILSVLHPMSANYIALENIWITVWHDNVSTATCQATFGDIIIHSTIYAAGTIQACHVIHISTVSGIIHLSKVLREGGIICQQKRHSMKRRWKWLHCIMNWASVDGERHKMKILSFWQTQTHLVPAGKEILTLFRWDLLCSLTFRTFRGGRLKKHPVYKTDQKQIWGEKLSLW